MTAETGATFQCLDCGRRFCWRPDIAGRTVRCVCGGKARCPDRAGGAADVEDALEDTVADVVLEEHLDRIAAPEGEPEDEEGATVYRRIPQRGMFGWPMGGEVLVWGFASLAGIALSILAAIMLDEYAPYTVGALLVGPYSWWRLWIAWPRWTQGRPWLECLGRALGVEEDEGTAPGGAS